jgi:hypothetical protein
MAAFSVPYTFRACVKLGFLAVYDVFGRNRKVPLLEVAFSV